MYSELYIVLFRLMYFREVKSDIQHFSDTIYENATLAVVKHAIGKVMKVKPIYLRNVVKNKDK